MIIGIPKEILQGENRVAATPEVVSKYIKAGFTVHIERDAGINAGFTNEKFAEAGGKIFACGTCLKQRNSAGSNLCPISTMKDMYRIVAESDKILTF